MPLSITPKLSTNRSLKGKEPVAEVAEVDCDSDDGGWNLTNPAWYDEQSELLGPQDRPQRPYIPTDDCPIGVSQPWKHPDVHIPVDEFRELIRKMENK